MRDVDGRRPAGLDDPADFPAHGGAQGGVQVGQRLIQQQALRPDRQGPRQRHPLLLPAGKLHRLGGGLLGHADGAEHVPHGLAGAGPVASRRTPGPKPTLPRRSCAARGRSSGTPWPRRAARRQVGDVLAAKKIRPLVGSTKPASIRSRVVLPQPLGPSRKNNSPASMDSEMSSTASTAPRRAAYTLLSFSRRNGSIAG